MSEERIIDKVKKLLSLSQSSNENEAALAAAMAAELMLKHEIKSAQVSHETVEGVGTTKVDQTTQMVGWKSILLDGLAKAFGCTFFSQRRYANGKTYTHYNVAGQPSKVDTIKYMYAYLIKEINRLAEMSYRKTAILDRAAREAPPRPRSWKNAFRLGATVIISKRLCEQRKATHKEAQEHGQGEALMVVKASEDAVSLYIAKTYPRMQKSTSTSSYSSESGRSAGESAGKKVRLGGASKSLNPQAKQLTS